MGGPHPADPARPQLDLGYQALTFCLCSTQHRPARSMGVVTAFRIERPPVCLDQLQCQEALVPQGHNEAIGLYLSSAAALPYQQWTSGTAPFDCLDSEQIQSPRMTVAHLPGLPRLHNTTGQPH